MSEKPAYRNPTFLLMILLWIIMGAAAWTFFNQYTDLMVWEKANISTEKDYFGGNDWVQWSDSANRIVATQIHPLLRNHPDLQEDYIRKGDRLKGIDYYPIYKAHEVEDLIFRAPPGKFYYFQIERTNPYSFTPETVNVLVEISFKPWFSFSENGFLWTISIWIYAIGGLISLVVLLILYPILKGKFRENIPLFLVLLSALFFFGNQIFRHINLLIQGDLGLVKSEKFFLSTLLILLGIYALSYLLARLPKKLKWMVTVPSLIYFGIIMASIRGIYGHHFQVFGSLVEETGAFLFLLMLMAVLSLSMVWNWGKKSLRDRIFHIASLIYAGGLVGYYAWGLWGGDAALANNEKVLFFSQLAIFIPLSNSAVSQLKFGKVSVVVTQTLTYILVGAGVFILYIAIHALLNAFQVSFQYQNLLEISILLLIVLLVWSIYKYFEDRLQRYFIFTQQKKRQQLDLFISQIPQYSSSQQLIEDLRKEVKEYFETDKVDLWLNETKVPPTLQSFKEEELYAIKDELRTQPQRFWTLNKQLNSGGLTAFESRLQKSGLHLLYLLDINENQTGLLAVGRKKRGVYNLADLEIFSRIIQQVRLTINVLQLLEREKLLIQKTYEANLTALRSQINPHFLFNTLNTISSLIHDDPDDAEIAVEKLAFIFRYTLRTSSENLVKLKDEMSLITTYLDIEKIRFGERLTVDIDIQPAAGEVTIPALVLQTIVENCIKHGISKIIGKGIVSIHAEIEDDFMVCRIEDNGPGIDLSRIKSSTGLTNTITRLEEIYQVKNLLYFENTGNGTLVKLKIPLPTDVKT